MKDLLILNKVKVQKQREGSIVFFTGGLTAYVNLAN